MDAPATEGHAMSLYGNSSPAARRWQVAGASIVPSNTQEVVLVFNRCSSFQCPQRGRQSPVDGAPTAAART